MPTMTTSDGITLHYRDQGRGSPLVIIPGWGCSGRYFDRQLASLSQRLRVVVLDPRGQGESEKTRRGQRMGRVTHDVYELLQALDLRSVTLLGWSLGTSVVLSYVDLFGSERVDRLICVGGGPLLINRAEWDKGFVDLAGADAWRTGLENDFQTVAGGIVERFFHEPPSDEEVRMLTRETLKTSPADGAAAMTWDCINQNYLDLLPHIKQPTLVLLGRHDTIVPITNAEVFAEIPHVRIEIFEDSAHAPFIEEADYFNETVSAFVLS